jgi:L-alanine-DL-glutamate epimerase-like enolase superfamily enzyme
MSTPNTSFNINADVELGFPNVSGARHLPALPIEENAVRITALETSIPPSFGGHLMLLRVHTDTGIIGCGESFFLGGAMASVIHDYLAERLLDGDALAIESHWRFAYERLANIGVRGAELRAISAIDVALWDILGQSANQPIYRLLGGPVRAEIPVYNSCANPTYSIDIARKTSARPKKNWPGMGSIGQPGPLSDSYNYFHNPVELAQELIELGYRAMKVWPFDLPAIKNGPMHINDADLQQAIAPLRKIREAVGMQIEVMFDGHGHFQLPAALRIADALRELKPLWLEDILKLDNLDTLADFRHQSRMPISVSEMLLNAPDYLSALEKRAADYVMIDPTWAGGISESIRIGRLAQAYNIPVSMHDATGPLTLFSGLHLLAALPNGLFQETARAQIHTAYKELIDEEVVIKNGAIGLPRRAGIGVGLNPNLFKTDAPGYRISRL